MEANGDWVLSMATAKRNQNQGFSLAPERMEETRTGLNANRKDKQHQPEGSQFLWNGYPPMPEGKSNKNYGRHIER